MKILLLISVLTGHLAAQPRFTTPTDVVTSFPYTFSSTDQGKRKELAPAGAAVVTMLAAGTAGAGWRTEFSNLTAHTITLGVQTGEAVNGTTNGTVPLPQCAAGYATSDGSAWRVVLTTIAPGNGVTSVCDPTSGRYIIGATEDRIVMAVANAGTTGTTVNKLAKVDSSGNALIVGTADTGGAIGVVIENAGTSGTATILAQGFVSLASEGNTTAGHYIGLSASSAGTGTSSATCPSGQVVGVWLQTGTGAANRTAYIRPGMCAAAGGGSSYDPLAKSEQLWSANTCIWEDNVNMRGTGFQQTVTGGSAAPYPSGTFDYPCAYELTTGATSGNQAFLFTGNVFFLRGFPNMGNPGTGRSWKLSFAKNFSSTASVRWLGGFTAVTGGSAPDTDTPASWIGARFSTNASDTTIKLLTCASSTCSTQASTVTISANTWYWIDLYSTTPGTICLAVNGETPVCSSTNVFTGANANYYDTISTLTTAAKSHRLGYFAMRWQGLVR